MQEHLPQQHSNSVHSLPPIISIIEPHEGVGRRKDSARKIKKKKEILNSKVII
jgi:hypothetical protein